MLSPHISTALASPRFSRRWFGTLFLLNSAILCAAFTIQYGWHVEPCPLCILQRCVTSGLILVSFIAIWVAHRHRWLAYCSHGLIVILLFAALGVAARHVWIEHLSPLDAPPACGASLEYLLQIMPWQEVFKTILTGSGECQKVTFRILGQSLATWNLLYASTLILIYCWLPWRIKRNTV